MACDATPLVRQSAIIGADATALAKAVAMASPWEIARDLASAGQ